MEARSDVAHHLGAREVDLVTCLDAAAAGRGYVRMYLDHVMQADEGADLDFLVGRTGSAVPRDNG